MNIIEKQMNKYRASFNKLEYEISNENKIVLLEASFIVGKTSNLKQEIYIKLLEHSDCALNISFLEEIKLSDGTVDKNLIQYYEGSGFLRSSDHWYKEQTSNSSEEIPKKHLTIFDNVLISSVPLLTEVKYKKWNDNLESDMLFIPRCYETISGILNEIEKQAPGFITYIASHFRNMKFVEKVWLGQLEFDKKDVHPAFLEIENIIKKIEPNIFMSNGGKQKTLQNKKMSRK